MKAAFPMGFIAMKSGSTDPSALAGNSTNKALMDSGAVHAGNDTYKFYDGDGSKGKGWPEMDNWVDFTSM